MKTKFSVVVPIHNEEEYLPHSLPSILQLVPDEVILLLDRCTDNSITVACSTYLKHRKENTQLRVIEVNEPCDWKFRLAYLFRKGYGLASNNIILVTAADIILDKKILEALVLLQKEDVALVSLGCVDYPSTYRSLISSFLHKVMLTPRFYGPYFFKRNKWLETEDQNSVSHIEIAEDAHLWLSLLTKYHMAVLSCRCYHLREKESVKRNYAKGRDYWRVAHRPLWFALATAIIMLRPSLFIGYLRARHG